MEAVDGLIEKLIEMPEKISEAVSNAPDEFDGLNPLEKLKAVKTVGTAGKWCKTFVESLKEDMIEFKD